GRRAAETHDEGPHRDLSGAAAAGHRLSLPRRGLAEAGVAARRRDALQQALQRRGLLPRVARPARPVHLRPHPRPRPAPPRPPPCPTAPPPRGRRRTSASPRPSPRTGAPTSTASPPTTS